MQNPGSKFKRVIRKECLNNNPLAQDTLIPIENGFTDNFILRGEYLTVTILIYGYLLNPN